jgi:hypothetical protein
MTPLVRLRRSVAFGLVAVLLAACGGAASQAPPTTATPSLLSTPLGAAAPSATESLQVASDAGWPSAPSPIVSQPPTTAPAPGSLLDPPARPGPFAIDLFRSADFVSQARADWCVPAAITMMAKLMDRQPTSAIPSQGVLDRRARALSSPRLVGLGSEPQGWAGALNGLGDGPYVVVARSRFGDAIAAAARALRLTGMPVGLLVWRGAHAWVMTGFEATGDPAWTNDFRVTAVRVTDPWYPRPFSAWGRTRAPDARVDLAALARNYVRWRRPTVRYAELDGRFVLILPVVAAVGG